MPTRALILFMTMNIMQANPESSCLSDTVLLQMNKWKINFRKNLRKCLLCPNPIHDHEYLQANPGSSFCLLF